MLQQDASGGLVTYHFVTLAQVGLVHAIFTRLGGVSVPPFDSLNVGRSVGDDSAAVAENHARIYAHLALSANQVASPMQTHGNQVTTVTAEDTGARLANTDGLVTNAPRVALLLRFADCQPILIYDPVARAVGLVHAGWRGVAQGIALRAVEAMQDAFGSRRSDLLVGLGPAIGPCCYTVGQNVASAMGYALPNWKEVMHQDGDQWRLDLSAANAQQLEAAGVQKIEHAQLCTSCHNDIFYSHRADNGRTGRFAVVTYLDAGNSGMTGAGATSPPGGIEAANSRQPDTLHPPGLPPFHDSQGVG